MLETLVVVGIGAVLIGLFISNWSNYQEKKVLESASRELVSGIRLARAKAINGEKPEEGCYFLNGYRADIDGGCNLVLTVLCNNQSGIPAEPITVKTIDSNYSLFCTASTIDFESLTGFAGAEKNIDLVYKKRTMPVLIRSSGEIEAGATSVTFCGPNSSLSGEECLCDSGYEDCDGESTNGCETVLGTITNCGGCGDECTAGGGCRQPSCQWGVCSYILFPNGTRCAGGEGCCLEGICVLGGC